MKKRLSVKEEDFYKLMSADTPVTSDASSGDNKKSLYDELDKIDSDYGVSYDKKQKLKLDKIDYKGMTDSEISELARSIFEDEAKTQKQTLADTAEVKKSNLTDKKAQAETSAERSRGQIKAEYADAAQATENNALKRGLGRSSVVLGNLTELETQKLAELTENDKQLQSTLKSINGEIAQLEVELGGAQKAADQKAESNITEKIAELKTERENKLTEALKYNNDVTAEETRTNNALVPGSYNEAYAVKAFEAGRDKANKVMAYYSTMSPEQAYNDFVSDSKMETYLGEFYDEMESYLKNRLNK